MMTPAPDSGSRSSSPLPTTPSGPAGGRAVRRRSVLAAGALGAAVGTAAVDTRPAHASVVTTDPFGLGVASGDPLPGSVILWTRLVGDGGTPLAARDAEVRWEVATDPRFRHCVRRGVARATAGLGHSVHVDATGLAPGREYWYRFRAGGHVSPAGRTVTAPAPWARLPSLRLAVASCNDFQNGYWPAFSGLADEDVDVVLHLGDYIYEYDAASAYPDRRHSPTETAGLNQLVTLADYRTRHAQYKSDPALQAAHARAPWIPTWDDHETENNYAGLVDEAGDTGAGHQAPEEFARQRAAAYQAYYEHMPIRARLRPGSPDLRIFRRFDFGDLVRISVLDTRQYRTDQPGGSSLDFGPEALGTANTAGTLTGADQDAWLRAQLASSHARWNVIAQQVMMSRIRFPDFTGSGLPYLSNLDQWDGYAPQRRRLLEFIAERGVRNPVVLAGDIHSTWFNDLRVDPDDATAPVVASEYVGTSISSDFPAAFDAPLKQWNPLVNPHVKHFDGSLRGYLRIDVDRERWRTEQRSVASIATPVSPVTTTAAFVTEAGHPGIVPA
jgi:alkaline phosphatase D